MKAIYGPSRPARGRHLTTSGRLARMYYNPEERNMKSISCLGDLRNYGVNLLTGEADSLSYRIVK